MASLSETALKLPAFRNEPYTDFNRPENRRRMEEAQAKVRAQLGREYDLLIGGERIRTAEKLKSLNPARPDEVVGIHQKASPEIANRAVETAYRNFRGMGRHARRRSRPHAGEDGRAASASANTSSTHGSCSRRARPGRRPKPKSRRPSISASITRVRCCASPGRSPWCSLPGERDEMRYLPLGVGIVIPPWNFALAILCGMTVAALVTGNTVVIKPSSETPTVAAVFAETLLEAGFPAQSFCFLTGSGGAIGDLLVAHPKTRFISFTGSRDVGLHINELAAKPQKGQLWIKRVVAEMGGKDAIIVDGDCDLDAAVEGVAVSAFGYQGQKCSACSRAIVRRKGL